MSAVWSESTGADAGRYRSDLGGTVYGTGEEDWNYHERSTMASAAGNGGQEPLASAGQGDENISATQRMISATWGSLLTSLLVTPLDVVRVRLQSQSPQTRGFTAHSTHAFKELPPNLGVTACCREVFWVGDSAQVCMLGPDAGTMGSSSTTAVSECAVEETQRRTFTSTFDGLRKIARNEGLSRLWRGLSPTLVMAIPANVIYFTGYDWLRFDPRSPIPRYFGDVWAPLMAGSAARIAAASVISPIEMFKTRLQATSGTGADHFTATLKDLHQMTKVSGYGSLWRGLTLTLWRDVPFSGLYWWGYEEARNSLTIMRTKAHSSSNDRSYRDLQLHESNTSTFVDSFIAGASSGAFAALVTTPFDVGKTRQQVFRHHIDDMPTSTAARAAAKSSHAVIHPEQFPMPKFLLHIFREEGFSGLFRGWVARCLKVAPACAIMISSYEVGKKMAREINERRLPEGEAV